MRAGVKFINPFTLCAELLRLKKASQKLDEERKWVYEIYTWAAERDSLKLVKDATRRGAK